MCPSCHTASVELDAAEGVLVCFACGHVLDEDILVNQRAWAEEGQAVEPAAGKVQECCVMCCGTEATRSDLPSCVGKTSCSIFS